MTDIHDDSLTEAEGAEAEGPSPDTVDEDALEGDAEQVEDEPSESAPRSTGPGTILIPAGERRLPDAMRPGPEEIEAAETADVDGAAGPLTDVGGRISIPPDPPSASFGADQRPPSLPPIRPNSVPPRVVGPRPTPVPAVDPDARREAIESRRSRRVLFLLIGLFLLAAALAAVAILVISNQREAQERARVEQVMQAHAIALDTVEDANEPIIEELERLAGDSDPDPSRLTELASEASALFDGLVVPVAEGEFVALGRNLQRAIDAELAFLDDLSEFAAIDVVDLQDRDIDLLLNSWDAVAESLRESYADQPEVERPEHAAMSGAITAAGSHLLQTGAEIRERQALIAEVESYMGQVTQVLAELEVLRGQLVQAGLAGRRITTSAESAAAAAVVDAGADGRWALAQRLRGMTPPSDFQAVHEELAAALENLGDVVTMLNDAIFEADCSYYYDYFFEDEFCPTLGETTGFSDFVRASDTAGARLDRARAALEVRKAEIVDGAR